jgi:hypothetical protein
VQPPPSNRIEKAVRVKRKLLKRFNLIWVVQSPLAKYFAFPSPQINGYSRAVSSRQEGRIARRHDARRDAVDATASARKGKRRADLLIRERFAARAYGKTVWSRHPLLVPS